MKMIKDNIRPKDEVRFALDRMNADVVGQGSFDSEPKPARDVAVRESM